ncbi:putative negative regulator of RcsB-dependent stress response [Sinobacterium caligoides]|uniref:Ancillary SecYEG translocon subunit n=1 Tax=Sinobacterium caligoides TaxID=933926 RepID=A0A3N2E0R9_9GAMM|nr:tetratricopeptide repeat protein [Sinobacterium caligoides]ROS05165.1 putative negative regulator of RcsB-dependent stress response [Sinobacterium caligoides]
METYRTEEEQVEAIKHWWKENGTSTLLTIAIVVAGYFGWQYYGQNQQASAEQASAIYQQLLEANDQLAQQPDDAQLATAHHLASQLKEDYEGSTYAQFAALINARLYVNSEDLVKAEAELRWVLEHSSQQSTTDVTELRLARVLDAQGKTDEAEQLIAKQRDGAMQVGFEELKGDILAAKGDPSGARTAYQQAKDLAAENKVQASPLLALKLQNLPAAKGE